MPTLSTRLKAAKAKKPTVPVWKGPEKEGITQSLLSRFLVCRERFRLRVVEGLAPKDKFEPRIEYGNMWHVCEEALSGFNSDGKYQTGSPDIWEPALKVHCRKLCDKYRLSQEQIDHWYQMCKAQFPVYVQYWSKHQDVKGRVPLFQEQVFNVFYKLPSGRVVRLRGKWDAGDYLPAHTENGYKYPAGVWLQENKTKSQLDQQKIIRQLSFDLQTMMYIVALGIHQKNLGVKDAKGFPIADPIIGVRYNGIRRSAHKTPEAMMEKIGKDLAAGRGDEWFSRWKVKISPADVTRFRSECLDPILEQLCDWWDMIKVSVHRSCSPWDLHSNFIHWRHPFGVYNVLDEGGSSDLDAYLETGSELGLQRGGSLFTELE